MSTAARQAAPPAPDDGRPGGAPARAIVVGAGVGGLCAAARLAAAGSEVVVLERLHQVGGRWSSRDIDGFRLPTGAFLIAMDDPLAETFAELNVDFPVRAIDERTVFSVNGRLVGTGERGGLRALVGTAAELDGSDADTVLTRLRAALVSPPPDGDVSLPQWLVSSGAGPVVVAAIHALVQAFMGLNAVEVTATAFLDYLRATAGRGRHGIPPAGSRSLAENLAGFVTSHGGDVRLGSGAKGLLVEDGRVVGAELAGGIRLRADVVVSDIGLAATAKLLEHADDEAAAKVRSVSAAVRGAPGITCFVASQQPFFDHPVVVVAGTRRVCLVTTPTLVAPELAPPGWHLTESISTFASSADCSDPKSELAEHLADLDDLLGDWRSRGRLLQSATYRGEWPVYRSWPGTDPTNRFLVPGLALVGDAVKPPGWPGTGASAESARLAVNDIREGRHEPALSPTNGLATEPGATRR
ncbi:MAG: FAD-dependent oxidoreductase [Actinomycetota bacterium]|nr:FAD-dependent oxidoreductase [Actinomycetota bacterium]